MRRHKPWTKEEDMYLEEHWGMQSVKTIAKNMNRSENAIVVRKQRLGLGAFFDSGDYITYSQLLQVLYGLDSAPSAYRNPKKGKDFPIRMKRVRKKKIPGGVSGRFLVLGGRKQTPA